MKKRMSVAVFMLVCLAMTGCATSNKWWNQPPREKDGLVYFVGSYTGPNTARSKEKAEDVGYGEIAKYIYSVVIRNAENIACDKSSEKGKNSSVKTTNDDVSKGLRILINQSRAAVTSAKRLKGYYDEHTGTYHALMCISKENTAIDAQKEFQTAIDGLAEKFAYDQQKLHEAIIELNGSIEDSLDLGGFEMQKSVV